MCHSVDGGGGGDLGEGEDGGLTGRGGGGGEVGGLTENGRDPPHGQCVVGIHPTGMHSCFSIVLDFPFTIRSDV